QHDTIETAGGRYKRRRPLSIRCSRRRTLRFRLEMRNDLLAEQAKRVHHLFVPRRPDGAQQEYLLDAKRFVDLEKADAVRRRADAEFGALLAHLLGGRFARMRPAGETLV